MFLFWLAFTLGFQCFHKANSTTLMAQVHPVVDYQLVGIRETKIVVPGSRIGKPQVVIGIVVVRDMKYRAAAGSGKVADIYL